MIKLLKNLKTTSSYCLKLKTGTSYKLCAYIDANWAGERGSGRKSRTCIAIYFGESLVYYTTTLQKCVSLSSTEAEFVPMYEFAKVVTWLRRVLEEVVIPKKKTPLYEDSGAITCSTGHVAEDFRRSKHIELQYFHVREKVQDKTVTVEKLSTKDMRADFLTKPLPISMLDTAYRQAGVVGINVEEGC